MMKHQCEVCNKDTNDCPPSPFSPCSYWKCNECRGEHRIAYWELLCVLGGGPHVVSPSGKAINNFDERLTELNELLRTDRTPKYGDHWLLPTLAFFNKTKEEAWAEKHLWEDERFRNENTR